jgi:hypothetical protein
METFADRVRAVTERCRARALDPEFQAQAERLKRENAEAEAASQEAERNLRLFEAGVPRRLWPTLAAPDATPALEAVKAWLAGPEECVFLVLGGEVGTGKSFAAAWAVRNGGRHTDAHSLVYAGQFDPIWAQLATTPVLALDELGAEHLNDAYRASLYALLNARYANARRTLLITNMAGQGFLSRYCPDGEADRLKDRLSTGGKWINVPGKSLRQKWASDAEPPPRPHNETDREETTP